MMLSTASQQPSVCKQHVHLENPVSASQILDACRNMGEGRGEEHVLIQYLMDLNLMTAAETTGEWTPCASSDTWETVLRKEVEKFEASQENPILSSVILHAAEALTLLNQYRKTCLFQDPTSMDSFDADESLSASSDGTEYEIVASIWWILQRFQATAVTVTPMACTVATARCLSELLHGIPVQILAPADATTDKRITQQNADGVAICRSLLGTASQSPSEPPPLLLQHLGSCKATTVIVGVRTAVQDPQPQQECNDSGCLETTTEADTLDSRQGESTTTELSQLERPYWNAHRELSLLEANIDDMTGEQLAFACEQLLADPDCLDVWLTPIIMKKGRPAHTLHCLVRNSQMQPLIVELFSLTTTLGVRVQNQQSGLCRVALRRVMVEVSVNNTVVRVKVGYIGPQVCSVKPEFEDCKQIALTSVLSLDQVIFEATAKAKIALNKQQQQQQQQQGEVLEVL